MPERGFLIFWIFLLFFPEFSCPGSVWTEFGTKIFFSLSRPISSRFSKIMPDRGFLIFWIFLLFFSEFSCLGWIWTEFGTKIFSSLSHPISVLAKNNSGMWFFNFFNFFAIYFGIFLPWSSINGIRDKNFFLSFSATLNPFSIEIMLELTFWIFLLFFFLEFSSLGWVGTEFGTKIFFSLSQPISSRFV